MKVEDLKIDLVKLNATIKKDIEEKKCWVDEGERLESFSVKYQETFSMLQEKIESKLIHLLNKFTLNVPNSKISLECEIKMETLPSFATSKEINGRRYINLKCFSAGNNKLKLYFEKGNLLFNGLITALLLPLKANCGIKQKEGIDYYVKDGEEILMAISTKNNNIAEEQLTPKTFFNFTDCFEVRFGEKTEICNARDAIIQAAMEAKVQHALDLKALTITKSSPSLSSSFVANKPKELGERKVKETYSTITSL